MVELVDDGLNFSFPDVHPQARLRIEFQRTLRIPDDGSVHFLPPGLGCFPLRHVDDFPSRVPRDWTTHGGVMLPMYQSEALWILFTASHIPGRAPYPFAIRVAAGKIDAVTGEPWSNELGARPQNYLVAPEQPWLDGFVVERGVIRQFVAMPLGAGYTAEEQITGTAEHGGLQILVHPMRRDVFERRFPVQRIRQLAIPDVMSELQMATCARSEAPMGLAPGGRMKQEIYDDPFDFADWDRSARSRCFVHLTNSLVWEAVTDEKPPTPPPTAKLYTRHGLPWFDYYSEGSRAVDGSTALKQLRSVLEMSAAKGEPALPENERIDADRVVRIRSTTRRPVVRDGMF